METELHFDLPLEIACPLVVVCLMLGAYMSAAETAITGASRPRMTASRNRATSAPF